MRKFKIKDKVITDDSDCFVIAEIGNNHKGDINIAKKMFQTAKKCGADAVKIQTRNNKFLFTKKLYNSDYNSYNSFGKTYGLHRESLEFEKKDYLYLKKYAEDLGLIFFSTPFDFKSVDFLEKINIPLYKIGSGDLTNIPLMEYINSTKKPIILSTGGGNIKDVLRAYEAIKKNKNLAILQCTSAYPCNAEDLNVRVVETYRKKFKNNIIGLSDHLSGISSSILAYALGARIIEKHFTLDRSWKGTDHSFSLEPQGFKKLISYLRESKKALGNGKKVALKKEKDPIFKMAKKLVASKNLSKGKKLERKDIAIKSPNDGVAPYHLSKFIGKTLKVDLKEDENLNFKFIE